MLEIINKKLEAIKIRWEDEGLYWLDVNRNIFPPIKWGPDGSMWVGDVIIVPKSIEESKAFIGTEWEIEINLFPNFTFKDNGLYWVLDDIIVERNTSVSTENGKFWDIVSHNLFTTVEEREGGVNWEVIENIGFPDQDVE